MFGAGNTRTFLISTLFLIPGAVLGILVHELAHAFVADREGDSTPRRRGLLRPDPRLFIDPYGALAILLLRTGWGRPAPVNEYRLGGTRAKLLYAFAGPLANLTIAVVFGLAFRFAGLSTRFDFAELAQPPAALATYVLYAAFFVNLALFAFNLLPIPGLDGWRVAEALFRNRWPKFFFDASIRRREIWIGCAAALLIASFIGLNLLALVLIPLFDPASTLILGGCAPYPGLAPCLQSAGL